MLRLSIQRYYVTIATIQSCPNKSLCKRSTIQKGFISIHLQVELDADGDILDDDVVGDVDKLGPSNTDALADGEGVAQNADRQGLLEIEA